MNKYIEMKGLMLIQNCHVASPHKQKPLSIVGPDDGSHDNREITIALDILVILFEISLSRDTF